MPVVPVQSALLAEDSAVTLARYAARVEYPECQFWGVRNDDELLEGDCRTIWTKMQRDTVSRYLAEAQFEIEELIGYFLSPRWVVGLRSEQPENDDRYVDAQSTNPGGRFITRWPKIITPGTRAVSNISLLEAVDHNSDPAVIGPIATSVTNPDEVKVYHPDTNVEIDPSKITISGGNLTIEIPRCRLVSEANADNPENGHDYDDVGNCSSSPIVEGVFECFVDVKRVYTDTSQTAVLVSPHRCTDICCSNDCSDYTRAACMYVRDTRRGEVDVRRTNGYPCDCPAIARLYYYAGVTHLSRQAEDAIIRLAHAKMPDEPCGCDTVQRLWARDRHIPEVLDRERLNCPFGLSDGAWVAYRFALSMVPDFRGRSW